MALRFYTYGVPLPQRAAAYVKTVLEDPFVTGLQGLPVIFSGPALNARRYTTK